MTYAVHMFAGDLVKNRRKAAGFSARTFAAAIGSSDRMVRRYEAGDIDPPLSIAGQMAKELGLPLDELYVHDAQPASPAEVREETTRATVTAGKR